MANVFIPASIRDKAVRDTLVSIVNSLGTGGSISVDTTDPTDTTPGAPGDIIYSTGSDSIWVFDGTAWVRSSGGAQGQFNLDIYLRSAGFPATPTGGSYDYETNTITPPVGDGWKVTVAELPPGDDPVYISTAVFDPATDTAPFTPNWGQPVQLGSPGADGLPGISVYISTNDGTVFKNSAGDAKMLTANVNLAGTVPSDTDYNNYEYDWTYEGMTVCVNDAQTRTVISTNGIPNVVDVNGVDGVCVIGLPADSENTAAIAGNLNTGVLRTIVVGPEDVNSQARFKVSVDIGG